MSRGGFSVYHESAGRPSVQQALRLVVALARCIRIKPEELAELYADSEAAQEYYDQVVHLVNKEEQ